MWLFFLTISLCVWRVCVCKRDCFVFFAYQNVLPLSNFRALFWVVTGYNTRQYHCCCRRRRRHSVRTKHNKRLPSPAFVHRAPSSWGGCRCASFVYIYIIIFFFSFWCEFFFRISVDTEYDVIDIMWQLYEATRPYRKSNNIILLAIAI